MHRMWKENVSQQFGNAREILLLAGCFKESCYFSD